MANQKGEEENKDKNFIDLFSIDLRNIQSSNIKLFIFSLIFLIVGIYTSNKLLRNEMIKGLFIVLFMQLLDYYTYWKHAEFLKHEKYLLSLTALVGEGLYVIFIKPRLSVK